MLAVGTGLPAKSTVIPMLILVLIEGHSLEDEMRKNYQLFGYEL